MRHVVRGRKLGRTASHRKALMANMATSLFEHKKIVTTEAKAKELRPYAEHLITKAKHALMREKQGLLPEGQTVDIHNRRVVGRVIKVKAVLQELFDAIAPVVESRNGGYTRVVKLGFRRGDAGQKAMIELVDWAAPQDGTVRMKSKRKAKSTKPTAKPVVAATPVVVEPAVPAVETVIEDTPIVDTQMVETVEVVEDAPVVSASEEPAKIVFDDTADSEQENKA